jgi:hypothetical protein
MPVHDLHALSKCHNTNTTAGDGWPAAIALRTIVGLDPPRVRLAGGSVKSLLGY